MVAVTCLAIFFNCQIVFQGGSVMLSIKGMLLNCKHSIVFPLPGYEWPSFPASSLVTDVTTFFYICHLVKCVVTSHCGFNLHLPNGQGCWTYFHVLIRHLHIFGKISLHIFCTCSNRTVFLLLSFETFSYILDSSSLSDMWFVSNFLLVCSLSFQYPHEIIFKAKCLTLMKANLPNFPSKDSVFGVKPK